MEVKKMITYRNVERYDTIYIYKDNDCIIRYNYFNDTITFCTKCEITIEEWEQIKRIIC